MNAINELKLEIAKLLAEKNRYKSALKRIYNWMQSPEPDSGEMRNEERDGIREIIRMALTKSVENIKGVYIDE